MNPLSDVISLLRPHAALSKPISARGQWGVRYAAYGRPGFALVMQGACWLSLEGAPPLRLDEGDFILLPATPAFCMSNEPGVPCIDQLPSDAPVRHGDPDGEPDVALFGGAFEIYGVNAPLLLGLLPATIHIRAGSATGRLGQIIALLGDECAAERPGADMIVDRLLEILLVECLRWRETDGHDLPAGLLAGLRDPGLARSARHSCGCPCRMAGGDAGKACRHVAIGLRRALRADTRLRAYRISGALANGIGAGCSGTRQHDARSHCRHDRL
jgi:hypothetical protein